MELDPIFEAIFETASIGILMVNEKGVIVKANPFTKHLFGYDVTELEGAKLAILIPENFREKHSQLHRQYHKKPIKRAMDSVSNFDAQHKEGHIFPVAISLDYLKRDGEILAVTYVSNISNQKKIEADLQESQARLSAVFDQSIDGIIAIDEKGIIETVNPAAATLFGYKNEEIIGENIKCLMPEPDRSGHDQYIENYKQTGRKRIIGIGREVTGKKKDGSTFPLQLSIKEIVVKNRKIFIGRLHNLSDEKATAAKLLRYTNALEQSNLELKETIQQLTEREQQLKDIQAVLQKEKSIAQMYLDIAGSMIVVLDEVGAIQLLNQRGAEILEIGVGETLGKNWVANFIPKKERTKINRLFQNIMARSATELAFSESHIQTAKGEKRLIWWHHRILLTENGGVQGTISSGVDITEQRQAEALLKESQLKLEQYAAELESKVKERTFQLEESKQQLEQSLVKEKKLGELKSRFVSMASHEFRTPLTSISSSASLIQTYIEKERLDKIPKNVERIRSSIRNLTNILNDFLSLEKLEVGKVVVQNQDVLLAEFLEELQDGIHPLLQSPTQLIVKNTIGTVIQTDPYLLRNILLNLLSNAIKYSPKGNPVELSLYQKDQQLVFEVSDHGIGIPKEDQVHLFSLFFRATNAENIKGTGLGLVIIKRYLNLLKGDITFESQEGKGSSFYVYLPMG